MDNNKIIKIINDHFGEESEILEVAMYAMSTLAVNDAIVRGIMNKDTETRGIPPEAFHLMKRFDNGLVQNQFWLENFAPIKMQLALDDVKLNTMRNYIQFGEEKNNKRALKQAKAILFSRFDVLTIIAFLYKGVQFAEEFDAKLRLCVQLTDELDQYFIEKGV